MAATLATGATPCSSAPGHISLVSNNAHLEVVRAHEDVGNARAHHADDPLIKVDGLALRKRVLHLCLHEAGQALDLQTAAVHETQSVAIHTWPVSRPREGRATA
eukprot:366199-Chlamydomonas_euryale.AAC.10